MELSHSPMESLPPPRSRLRPDRLDQPLLITPSRRRILELVHKYRYMTPRLLAVAYGKDRGGRGLSHVRHELGALWRHGYALRHFWTQGPLGYGSPELIYAITPKGAREILDSEAYAQVRQLIYRRASERRANFDHHLALTQLELVLELGARDWRVAGYNSDERRARVQLKLAGKAYGLQPDAWVLAEFPDGQRALLLVEMDIARRENARLDQRFLAYGTLLSTRLEDLKKRYGVNNVIALFVEPSDDEVARVRGRAIEVVREAKFSPRPYFVFWNRGAWFEEQQLARRHLAGRNGVRERTWTVRVLRDPAEVLANALVTGMSGRQRPLFQG